MQFEFQPHFLPSLCFLLFPVDDFSGSLAWIFRTLWRRLIRAPLDIFPCLLQFHSLFCLSPFLKSKVPLCLLLTKSSFLAPSGPLRIFLSGHFPPTYSFPLGTTSPSLAVSFSRDSPVESHNFFFFPYSLTEQAYSRGSFRT